MKVTIMSTTILSDNHNIEDFPISACNHLKALWKMEDFHFWPCERKRFILKHLEHLNIKKGSRIMEVGCGFGPVSKYLDNK